MERKGDMTVTDLERYAMDLLTNCAEPTWILLEDVPEWPGGRAGLEAVLIGFEEKGMVRRTRELSGNPAGQATELDDWWALTQEGWSSLNQKMPPRY